VRPNLPNSISLFRVLMVPVLMVFLLADIPAGDIVALGVFLVASASDWLDGYIARRRHQTSVMGAFLDPLADKLLVTAALVSLVGLGDLPAWVAMVVIARELAVTGLRMVAAAKSIIISASRWGKIKTVSQMAAIATLIIEKRWLRPEDWTLWGHKVTWYLVVVMLVLTVISGVIYFARTYGQLGAPLVQDGGRAPDRTKEE
jgi:CDP-diacylglycerol--glycerol-3-phosphate 3-phosphatidyltransferase